MKKYIISAFAALTLAVSCVDLDRNPLSEGSSENWFSNEQVVRIQQLNLNYTDEKDIAEIVEACFRKPNEGEKVKAMNTKQMIELIRREYPSVKSDQSTKIHLGYAMKDLGFEHTERGHVKFYNVVPLKAA